MKRTVILILLGIFVHICSQETISHHSLLSAVREKNCAAMDRFSAKLCAMPQNCTTKIIIENLRIPEIAKVAQEQTLQRVPAYTSKGRNCMFGIRIVFGVVCFYTALNLLLEPTAFGAYSLSGTAIGYSVSELGGQGIIALKTYLLPEQHIERALARITSFAETIDLEKQPLLQNAL